MIMITYANNRITYAYVHYFFFLLIKSHRQNVNDPRLSATTHEPVHIIINAFQQTCSIPIYYNIYYAYNIINAYIRCEDLCFSSGRFETIRFCALNAFMLQGAK